nr:hypothetical protein [Tanacetum cinerariifolium]
LPVSPPLPVSSPPLPASPTCPLGYRAAMIQLRAKAPSTSYPPPPIVLPHTWASVAMLKAATPPTRGFRANYRFFGTLDHEIRRDPEREVGYGSTDSWDEMLVGMSGVPVTDETELGMRMTYFSPL